MAASADHVQIAVVGGGQAGLSVAHELAAIGLEPVVLERGRVGQAWRDRWESFCLVTPNWCIQSGFRPDYRSWLDWPGAFDDLGFPIHEDGESVAMPGVFFVGVHFLRKRKSALLLGVGEDAAIVARRAASRVGS